MEVEGNITMGALTRFGAGSNSKHVVHVRNTIKELDFEVLYSPGEYGKEVLGFLEHSDDRWPRSPRKFRETDE